MLIIVVVVAVLLAAACVFINYQVQALRKTLNSPAWTWLVVAFVVMLINLLWSYGDLGHYLYHIGGQIPSPTTPLNQRPQPPQVPVWYIYLRTARQFIAPLLMMGCFILSFHKLHQSLAPVEKIKRGHS